MKKRYLLLRNNIERGPFTLDELLQQQLVPNDLLWVEGESHEWKYFREIIDLGFFKANNNEETIVYIETPSGSSPITKEDIAGEENNLSEVMAHNEEVDAEAEDIVYNKEPKKLQDFFYPEENDDEENIDLVYHKRTRTSAFVQLFVLAAFVTLMALGWNHNGPLFKLNYNSDQAAVPLLSTTTHTAKAENKLPAAVTVPALAADTAKALANDSIYKLSDSLLALKQPERKPEVVAEKKLVKKEVRVTADETHPLPDQGNTYKKPAENAATTSVITEKKEQVQQTTSPDNSTRTTADAKQDNTAPQQEENTAATTEKRKTLGQVLKGLFHKKRKEETTATE